MIVFLSDKAISLRYRYRRNSSNRVMYRGLFDVNLMLEMIRKIEESHDGWKMINDATVFDLARDLVLQVGGLLSLQKILIMKFSWTSNGARWGCWARWGVDRWDEGVYRLSREIALSYEDFWMSLIASASGIVIEPYQLEPWNKESEMKAESNYRGCFAFDRADHRRDGKWRSVHKTCIASRCSQKSASTRLSFAFACSLTTNFDLPISWTGRTIPEIAKSGDIISNSSTNERKIQKQMRENKKKWKEFLQAKSG